MTEPRRQPQRIVIERTENPPWLMRIEDADGDTLDYTFASTRWLVWHMACLSWRSLHRRARPRHGGRIPR